jgi:hypothetical protein
MMTATKSEQKEPWRASKLKKDEVFGEKFNFLRLEQL